jgi:hypothetical protein
VIVTTTAPGIRRRSLLSAGLLGLLTACGSTAGSSGDGRAARTVDAPDPDAPIRARAVHAGRQLAAHYDLVLTAFPALAGRLEPLRRQLDAQAAAFGGTPAAGAAGTSGSADAAAAAGTAAPSSAPAAAAPGTAGAALLYLDAAERDTARSRTADLLRASPALARQLAAAAAASAQHSMILRGSVPAAPADPPVTTAPLPAPALAALRAALAAEDAAVYAYGVIGAQLDGARRSRATASYQAHRDRRGALQRRIAAGGAQPPAAAPAYRLPTPVADAASAVALAALVEDRVCAVYANAVQATEGPLRIGMATALRQSALDVLAWRGSGSAFPGLPHG